MNNNNNYIALKVGTEYIIITKDEVSSYGIDITSCGSSIKEINNTYTLFKGTTFNESQKLDRLFDSGRYETKKIKRENIMQI